MSFVTKYRILGGYAAFSGVGMRATVGVAWETQAYRFSRWQ